LRRRRLVALSVVPLLLLGTAACGSSDQGSPQNQQSTGSASHGVPGVHVSGSFGSAPTVKVDAPLKLDHTETQVLEQGNGDPVQRNKQVLLDLYLANGTTGKKIAATYDQGVPFTGTVASGSMWPGVIDAIVGKKVGTRMVVAAVPKDAYGASGAPQLHLSGKDDVVFVVDIVSAEPGHVLSGPQGSKPANLPSDLPTVVEKSGKVTGLDFSQAPKQPSKKLQVYTLIQGKGEPVRKGSLVTFNYLGQIYGSDKVFDESYSSGPRTFPVGVHGLIKGWDEGLVGVKTGSRVLIIVPPDYGYGPSGNPQSNPPIKGTDTLAFVIDVLGVG